MSPTRPSITNNPLPNHNFGKGPRINCLMTKEENKEDPFDLIYDLLECFMMTWEELMDMTSTTTTGYDIWNEIPEPKRTLQTPRKWPNTYKWGKILQTPRHRPNDPTKISLITKGETLQTPTFRDQQPSGSFDQIHPTNTCQRR